MKLSFVAIVAFLLGMAFGPVRAKAGLASVAYVTKVDTTGPETVVGTVMGMSCTYDGKQGHCYIVSQQQ